MQTRASNSKQQITYHNEYGDDESDYVLESDADNDNDNDSDYEMEGST